MIGLGCMRLSTAAGRDRDEALAIRVLHRAIESGVGLLDTADVYAPDEHGIGHNERLIAKALAERPDLRDRVLVATKGGLRRRGAAWIVDGRAKHLRSACENSLHALGVEQIALYQLHAPDPDVFSSSIRALAALKKEGKIAAVGLCNVRVDQIEAARSIVDIASVQIALSPFADAGFRSGVPEYCRAHEIRLIAHTPLGGVKKKSALERHPMLVALAKKHGASPAQIALAWLLDLGPNIVPIPGATRAETAIELGAASRIALDDQDRAALDEAFSFGRLLRWDRASRRPSDPSGEVVVLMGIQAAGKSTIAASLVERGYVRLNRDERGGRISGLHRELDRRLASGERRVVVDNTYPSRAARNEVIETAWRHGLSTRCIFLDTPIEEAQLNSILRMIGRHNKLLDPQEIRILSKKDPNIFGPGVQYRWLEEHERPRLEEGFESVEVVPFVRSWPNDHRGRAVFLELDGVVRRSRSGERIPIEPADVEIIDSRAAVLRRLASDGYLIVGLAWVPEVEQEKTTPDRVEACFLATQAAIDAPMELLHCPHAPGPMTCWCRRPLPGLGVLMIESRRLDPSACLMVGKSAADKLFAGRLGFRYFEADEFFGAPTP